VTDSVRSLSLGYMLIFVNIDTDIVYTTSIYPSPEKRNWTSKINPNRADYQLICRDLIISATRLYFFLSSK